MEGLPGVWVVKTGAASAEGMVSNLETMTCTQEQDHMTPQPKNKCGEDKDSN